MGIDPVAGKQLDEQGPIKAALAAIVDILGCCPMLQLRKAPAGGKLVRGRLPNHRCGGTIPATAGSLILLQREISDVV